MRPSASKSTTSPHGGGLRGADVGKRSSLFEGRFGRMFRESRPPSTARTRSSSSAAQ